MFFRLIGLFLLLSFLNGGAAGAEETGKKILTETCSACHNLTGPSSQTLQDLWTRKGPDLFYAGNKYKANWVESWLQKPTRIRPAGMYYGNHVKPGEKGDQVDPSTLTIHPVLSQQDAKAVTKAVMTLKGKGDLIHPGDYQPGTISETMGEMLFDKFRGCLACHEIEPDYGGLSGPELFTAAKRLQEDYMISFMRNPQAWEPKAFMPNKHLAETDLQKLVHYMRFLSREDHP
jgi:mono/diheme cytochrome c family protein